MDRDGSFQDRPFFLTYFKILFIIKPMDISRSGKSDHVRYAEYGVMPGIGLVTYILDLENRLHALVPDTFNTHCNLPDAESAVLARCAAAYLELKERTDALGLGPMVGMSEIDESLYFAAQDGKSPMGREPCVSVNRLVVDQERPFGVYKDILTCKGPDGWVALPLSGPR